MNLTHRFAACFALLLLYLPSIALAQSTAPQVSLSGTGISVPNGNECLIMESTLDLPHADAWGYRAEFFVKLPNPIGIPGTPSAYYYIKTDVRQSNYYFMNGWMGTLDYGKMPPLNIFDRFTADPVHIICGPGQECPVLSPDGSYTVVVKWYEETSRTSDLEPTFTWKLIGQTEAQVQVEYPESDDDGDIDND